MTEQDKDDTETHLKVTLTRAFKDGSAWVVDWDKEPLPRFVVSLSHLVVKTSIITFIFARFLSLESFASM